MKKLKISLVVLSVLSMYHLIICAESSTIKCKADTEECIPAAQCQIDFENEILTIGNGDCDVNRVCCEKEKNLKAIDPPCGQRNIMGLGQYEPVMDHLNVSETAKLAEFPWLVSIEVNKEKICTGSLINENVVMTSAGCVIARNAESVKVRAGSWKSSTKVGLQTEELRDVTRIISLDETVNRFRPSIALIILEKPIKINMFVGATCLKSSLKALDMNDCLAVGWKTGGSALDDLIVESKIGLHSCAELMTEGDVMLPGRSKCANMNQNLEIGSAVMCKINEAEIAYQQVGIVSQVLPEFSVAFLIDIEQFIIQIDNKMSELEFNKETYKFYMLHKPISSRISTSTSTFSRITAPLWKILKKSFPTLLADE